MTHPSSSRRVQREGPLLRGLALAVAGLLWAPTVTSDLTAQPVSGLRGTVVEAGSGRPLGGAQVSIDGTQRGGVADARGQFLIPNIPPGERTVRIQFIGLRPVERVVNFVAGETAVLNVEMTPSPIGLDDIIVTGTAGGTQRRALGNTVAQINAASITEVAPVTNVQQLLQARAPGVVLSTSTGAVGGSSKIRIRGASSYSAGNDPVVFVDGVRVESGTYRLEGNTSQGVNLLEWINPNDIESVEIIKGPAAATLYGAEASAGVIQIITKRGRPGEGVRWEAGFEYGGVDWNLDRPVTYWLCEDAHINNATGFPGCQIFSTSQPLSERVLEDHPFDPKRRSAGVVHRLEQRGLPIDRFECLFPQQAPCQPNPIRNGMTQAQRLSVRGGGDAFNFFISGERSREEGTFYNNYSNRNSARANFSFVANDKADFGVTASYVQSEQRMPQSDNSSNSVLRNAYRGQAGGPADQYYPGYRNMHPEFSNKHNRVQTSERLVLGLSANYRPFSWWQNSLRVGLDRNDWENRAWTELDQTGLAPFGAAAAQGSLSLAYPLTHIWTVDLASTFRHRLGADWSSELSAGLQYISRRQQTRTLTGEQFVANKLNLISAAAVRNAFQSYSEQNSVGFYVNEQVGWRDRVYVTGAVRVDDNSAFGDEFSVVVYPKAMASWVISEEDFWRFDRISDLKLRMAWGRAGTAPAPFSADRTYSAARAVINNNAVNRLQTSSYGNPNLKAETGQELEVGFDADLLEGRVGVEFTYYLQQTKDALLPVPAPPSSGWVGNYFVNVGEIRNSGLELSFDVAAYRSPSIQWDTRVSLATNANELVSFGKDAQGNPIRDEERFGSFIATQRHREGYPLGGYWAQDVLRDAQGRPVLNQAGQAIVPTCTWPPQTPEDCTEEYVGPQLPTRTVGFTNTVTLFRNLRLYSFLDYRGGNYQWCAICSVRDRIDLNTRRIVDARIAFLEGTDPYEWARLRSLQTKEYIYPADFLKLRELSVSYTIPQDWIARTGASQATVSLSGRNLWMWTAYKGGPDPEVAFDSGTEFNTSDYASIPQLRRWVFTMNFSF